MTRGLQLAPVNADGVLADLDLSATAYRVLHKMRSASEPGGRVEIEQKKLAVQLNVSRPAVTAAVRSLELAKLLRRRGRNSAVYWINAMLASYEAPDDARAAIAEMPPEERMDDPLFIERYREATTEYAVELAAKRRQKQRAALRAVS